jgi:hypothetical protein
MHAWIDALFVRRCEQTYMGLHAWYDSDPHQEFTGKKVLMQVGSWASTNIGICMLRFQAFTQHECVGAGGVLS